MKISGTEGGEAGEGQILGQLSLYSFLQVQGTFRMARLGKGGYHALGPGVDDAQKGEALRRVRAARRVLPGPRWEAMASHLLPLLALSIQQGSENR